VETVATPLSTYGYAGLAASREGQVVWVGCGSRVERLEDNDRRVCRVRGGCKRGSKMRRERTPLAPYSLVTMNQNCQRSVPDPPPGVTDTLTVGTDCCPQLTTPGARGSGATPGSLSAP